jgi:LPXTG-motif cell wall-anchored protein
MQARVDAAITQNYTDPVLRLVVEKTNLLDMPLTATFSLYRVVGGTQEATPLSVNGAATFQTSAVSGRVTIHAKDVANGLAPGSYRLVEEAPPTWHITSDRFTQHTRDFIITDDQLIHTYDFTTDTYTYATGEAVLVADDEEFVNDFDRAELTITKDQFYNDKDASLADKQPIDGAVYTLANITTAVTKPGEANSAWALYLAEITLATPVGVTINGDDTLTLTMDPAAVASTGVYLLQNLPWGTYELTEVAAPNGTAIGDPQTHSFTLPSVVTGSEATTGTNTQPTDTLSGAAYPARTEPFVNPVIRVVIEKINTMGDKLSAGFVIWAVGAGGAETLVPGTGTISGSDVTPLLITNAATGQITFPADGNGALALVPGTYRVEEITPPDDHDLSERLDATFTISADDTVYIHSFTVDPVLNPVDAAHESRHIPTGAQARHGAAFVNPASSGTLIVDNNKYNQGVNAGNLSGYNEAPLAGTRYVLSAVTLNVSTAWNGSGGLLDQITPASGNRNDGSPTTIPGVTFGPSDTLIIVTPDDTTAPTPIGHVEIPGMPYGTYSLVQTDASPGTAIGKEALGELDQNGATSRIPADANELTIAKNPGGDAETHLTLYNPVIQVAVEKTNAPSLALGHPLVATFKIIDRNGDMIDPNAWQWNYLSTTAPTSAALVTDSASGSFVYPPSTADVPVAFFNAGTYKVVETTAPNFHELNRLPQYEQSFGTTSKLTKFYYSFTGTEYLPAAGGVSAADRQAAYEAHFSPFVNDYLRGQFTIEKYRTEGSTQVRIAGAKFRLTATQPMVGPADDVIYGVGSPATTSWTAFLYELSSGGRTIPGVSIATDDPQTLIIDMSNVDGSARDIITVPGLPWGLYNLTEIAAPAGTVIGWDTKSQNFVLADPAAQGVAAWVQANVTDPNVQVVTAASNAPTLTFKNPTLTVKVEKTNRLGMPLRATFSLYRLTAGTPGPAIAINGAATFQTGADGTFTFTSTQVAGGLTPGDYRISELTAPTYHDLAEPAVRDRDFTVTDGQTQYLYSFTVDPVIADAAARAAQEYHDFTIPYIHTADDAYDSAFVNDYKRGSLTLTKAALYGTIGRDAAAEDAVFTLRNISTFVTDTGVNDAWALYLAEINDSDWPQTTLPAYVSINGADLVISLAGVADATAVIESLPWGEYELTETTASTGTSVGFPVTSFFIGDPVQTGKPGAVVDKAFTGANEIHNQVLRLVVAKTNKAGWPLADAQFRVRRVSDGDTQVLTTGANGLAVFPADDVKGDWGWLKPDTYEIEEIKPPAYHRLTDVDPVKTFTITAAQTEYVIFFTDGLANAPADMPELAAGLTAQARHDAFVNPLTRGQLEIIKLSNEPAGQPKNRLAGAEFTVTPVDLLAKPAAQTPPLKTAWQIFVEEVEALKAQVPDALPDVRVPAGKGSVIVTIPAAGSYTLVGLPVGDYTVQETRAPLGFAVDEMAPRSVTVADVVNPNEPSTYTLPDSLITETFTDTRYQVKIKKWTEDGAGTLAGAQFAILKLTAAQLQTAVATGQYPPEAVVYSAFPLTDGNGYTESDDTLVLAEGTYYLAEIKAPLNYGDDAYFKATLLGNPVRSFTVVNPQSEYLINYSYEAADRDLLDPMPDKIRNHVQRATLNIEERLSTDQSLLGGGVFQLERIFTFSGDIGWERFVSEVEDAQGTLIASLNAARLLAARSDAGLGLVTPDRQISITRLNANTLEIRSIPYTGIYKGVIRFAVPWGEYKVTHMQASDGYVRDLDDGDVDETHHRTLTAYAGDPAVINSEPELKQLLPSQGDVANYKLSPTLTFTDTPIILRVQKVNNFGRNVSGVTFRLTRLGASNEALETRVTNGSGMVQFTSLLRDGTYQLLETNSGALHDGNEERSFTVRKGQMKWLYDYTDHTLTTDEANRVQVDEDPLVNQIRTGDVTILKVSEGTGQPLAGAEFTVHQTRAASAAVAIDDQVAVSNYEGRATFNWLPYGTYTVRETRAPVGYNLVPRVVSFTISATSDNDRVITYEDPQMYGGLRVYKIDGVDSLPLAGATFRLYGDSDYNASVDLTGTTDSSGYIYFNRLPYGRYTLQETATPDPTKYGTLAAPVTVIIGRQESITVTVRNYESGTSGVLGVVDEEGVLPATGESLPVALYGGIGALLLAIAVLLLVVRRKRQQKHAQE